MTDCLIVGFNDYTFPDYVGMVSSMGTRSGAYRDLSLAFVTLENKPLRSMDVLNRFFAEGKNGVHKPFHNADFLWPVITYLGTYLNRRGHSFDYINLPHLEREELREKLQRNDILTIAITTTLYVSPHPILDLIAFIREHNHTAKIIVGGPFISNQPKLGNSEAICNLFESLGADIYVISQEGETALVEIIRSLKADTTLAHVNNIAYRQDGRYVFTAILPESNSLEENMVDYSLFRPGINEFVTLRTAKSCPFSCSFCGFPQRAGKYRYMNVELVEQELNAIRGLGGVNTLTFIDDTFNVPKERFRDLLRMMIRNNYGFKWNSFYRSDHGDEQTIELMARAGCEGVFLGVESGSDAMLQRMNKAARRRHYRIAIPLLQGAGISSHVNVIVGFPGETFETVQETSDLIEETRPDFFRAQLWYADPVTPIWKEKEQYGVTGSAFSWSHNTMDSDTACDLVDRMFLSIGNSTWLPQNGFEQWSIFYLQRKGMRMQQVKNFLRCFNAAIREKLLLPGRQEISRELFAALRQSAQFDRKIEPEMHAVEVYGHYRAAEGFVAQEFNGAGPPSRPQRADSSGTEETEFQRVHYEIDRLTVEKIVAAASADLQDVILAAYAIFISRLCGEEDIAILATEAGKGLEGARTFRIAPAGEAAFADFLQDVHAGRTRAAGHGRFVFYILGSPTLMALHSGTPAVFHFGFHFHPMDDRQEKTAIERELSCYPDLCHDLKLVLEVSPGPKNLEFEFSCRRNWQPKGAIEGMKACLTSIFRDAVDDGVLLKNIAAGEWRTDMDATIQTHAAEAFHF